MQFADVHHVFIHLDAHGTAEVELFTGLLLILPALLWTPLTVG